jgi:hypothetical protein
MEKRIEYVLDGSYFEISCEDGLIFLESGVLGREESTAVFSCNPEQLKELISAMEEILERAKK